MQLTKSEREILNHRLEASDALAEVLDEYHSEDVDAVCGFLLKDDFRNAERVSQQLTKDVLADCVEGSTILGQSMDLSPQKVAGLMRALESLADKIEKYVGRKLEVPAC